MTKMTKANRGESSPDVHGDSEPIVFRPASDIFENNECVRVRCDLPGVSEQQLEITHENNVLTLTGRQDRETPKGYDLVRGEYQSGMYRRRFTTSNAIDANGIKARLRNGVLDIELPKVKEAQPRKIPVEMESVTEGGDQSHETPNS